MDEESNDGEASASDILVDFDDNDLREIQEIVENIDAIDQKHKFRRKCDVMAQTVCIDSEFERVHHRQSRLTWRPKSL